MADPLTQGVQINELPQAAELNDDDLFVLQQQGEAKSLLGSVLKEMLGGGSGDDESATSAAASAAAAEASAAAAANSATAAETAQGKAESAQDGAESAAENAARAEQATVNLVNFAEDAVLNARNAQAAAQTSETNAKTSETNAASSATTAQNAANETKGYRDEVAEMLENAEVDPADAVLVTEQTLTEAQKAQARANIDVMSRTEVSDLVDAAISGKPDAYETVDSVAEMTDTTKSYILSTTGTLWSYLPTETTQEVEKTEQIVGTEDNPYEQGRLSDGAANGISGYVTTPYIDLLKYPGAFTLYLKGNSWLNGPSGTSYMRFATYDTSKAHITTQLTNSSAINTYTDNATLTGNTEDGSVTINFPQPATASTGVTVGFMRFSGAGTETAADVYVVYKDTETVMGDPQWTDTGIVVSEITEFAIVNSSVQNYMALTDYSDDPGYTKTKVTDYCAKDYFRKDLSLPAVLTWDSDPLAADYAVSLGSTETFEAADADIRYTKTNRLALYNLLPGETCYYKVYAMQVNGAKKLLKEGSFAIGTGPRMLHIDGIQNVRDIGGYTGLDGKTVKYGQIFRGSAMDEEADEIKRISGNGAHALMLCGVKTDIDLRYGRSVSPLGTHGIDYINTKYGYGNYIDAITNVTHQKAFANLLNNIVTQLTADKPCYIHCSGGCDRTGTLIFLLLGLLGVSESDLAKEYELSSFSPIGYTRTRNASGANINYPGMVNALVSGFAGDTLTTRFETFVTTCVTAENEARTAAGETAMLDAATLIDSFQSLMLE